MDIGERPDAWPLWRDDRAYRKRVLTRFPYVIFYELIGQLLKPILASPRTGVVRFQSKERGTRCGGPRVPKSSRY